MNTEEQAIRRLVAQWHSATAAGDVETVLGLMAEDVVFLVPGQAPMKGRSTFETGLRGLLTSHRLESTSDIQEVYVSGDLGYCWSLLPCASRLCPLGMRSYGRVVRCPFFVSRRMRSGWSCATRIC